MRVEPARGLRDALRHLHVLRGLGHARGGVARCRRSPDTGRVRPLRVRPLAGPADAEHRRRADPRGGWRARGWPVGARGGPRHGQPPLDLDQRPHLPLARFRADHLRARGRRRRPPVGRLAPADAHEGRQPAPARRPGPVPGRPATHHRHPQRGARRQPRPRRRPDVLHDRPGQRRARVHEHRPVRPRPGGDRQGRARRLVLGRRRVPRVDRALQLTGRDDPADRARPVRRPGHRSERGERGAEQLLRRLTRRRAGPQRDPSRRVPRPAHEPRPRGPDRQRRRHEALRGHAEPAQHALGQLRLGVRLRRSLRGDDGGRHRGSRRRRLVPQPADRRDRHHAAVGAGADRGMALPRGIDLHDGPPDAERAAHQRPVVQWRRQAARRRAR